MADGAREDEKAPEDEHISSAPTVRAEPGAAYAPTATPEGPGGSRPFAPGSTGPKVVDLSSHPIAGDGAFESRYASGDKVLGRGGMGEVRLRVDARIGREVAVKSIRGGGAASADVVSRFLREARVQGQLEHPAIVPVYDLGVGEDGAPFFTMKRLRGETLERILRRRREGDAATRDRYGRRKLLTDFARVCRAIEFAHSRGVVHRDLKPSNVMLGDFGEVYVLDWGVAKIAGVDDESAGGTPDAGDAHVLDGGGSTEAGDVLGTPGYMAPEQLRGDQASVGEAADVYALGAILFEILADEPLHALGDARAIMDATLAGIDARPSARAGGEEVPPELDEVCAKATAVDRNERYASVAAMVADLERYLDGDRDLERRRELAAEHAARALALSEAIFEGRGGDDARAEALREAGRAVSLDPDNADAAGVLTRLMLEPPAEMPPEVEEAHRASMAYTSRLEARNASATYLLFLLFVPFMMWMGVRDWLLIGVMAGGVVFLSIYAWYVSARRDGFSEGPILVAIVVNALILGLLTRVLGPLVLVPAFTAVSTAVFLLHGHLRRRALALAIGCAPIVVPLFLEWLEVLPPSYAFENGRMVILPQMTDLPETATIVTLLAGLLTIMMTSGFLITLVRDAQFDAERRLFYQSWQLEQLMPESSRHAVRPPERELPDCILER